MRYYLITFIIADNFKKDKYFLLIFKKSALCTKSLLLLIAYLTKNSLPGAGSFSQIGLKKFFCHFFGFFQRTELIASCPERSGIFHACQVPGGMFPGFPDG